MPEGDTLYRTAAVMRQTLKDDEIVAARGRPGGAQLARLVGSRVERVSTRGKHLLVAFENGLTLHTHLQMNGSWHRYRPGEPWRADAGDAVAVIETASATAVCFAAPTVELMETRAVAIHPVLTELGPDLLDEEPDLDEVVARLRAGSVHERSIAEALLDQRIVAGIGNVYRSEVLFIESQHPFAAASAIARDDLLPLLRTARQMLRANVSGGERQTMPDALGAAPGLSSGGLKNTSRWVYDRAGRPCRRCGVAIRSTTLGRLPRRLYWCPACQKPGV